VTSESALPHLPSVASAGYPDPVRSGAPTIKVSAAVMVRDGACVLLARRPPGDRLAGFWELPGGKIEVGESPEACLARELAEECGIEAQGGRHRSCAGSNFHLTTRATLSWPSWWGATHVWLWLASSTR